MSRDMRRVADSPQNFAANSPISFTLPVTSVYKEINLLLEYAASTGVGGALVAPIFDRSPWTAIKRIELIADGRDTIKSYDGGTLLDINHWDFGEYPPTQIAALGASASNGTTTKPLSHLLTISLESVGMMPEFDPQTGKIIGGPNMTLLDARKLSGLELRITFGAGLADIFTTVTAPATLDLYRITPLTHEILDISRENSFAVNQEIMSSQAFPTNTATDKGFRQNVGNAYRRSFISSVDQNARAAVDRLTEITLEENGTFNRRIWDAGAIKQHNSRNGQLAVGMGNGVAPTATPAINGTQGKNGGNRLGLYVVDIAEDGKVASLLDTRGYSDLQYKLDWDGANTTDLIRITNTIIVPNLR